MNVLVIDVGGSHVKLLATGHSEPRKFDSGRHLTPAGLVEQVRERAAGSRELQAAFVADYVVLGGGQAEDVDPLPEGARRGGNADAFTGGFRLWEETVEPYDGPPSGAWRVVM